MVFALGFGLCVSSHCGFPWIAFSWQDLDATMGRMRRPQSTATLLTFGRILDFDQGDVD